MRSKLLFPLRYSEDALQAMYKKNPNLGFIKVFCCSPFVRVENVLEARSIKLLNEECFLVSSDNSKTYFVDIPNDKGIFKLRKPRNVTFNKHETFYRN